MSFFKKVLKVEGIKYYNEKAQIILDKLEKEKIIKK